ncbi:MAG: hypothetical protein N2652_05780 [Kiritimatiellae bacterium]|nr:hypothetical protein [Kiritimatiellia bacterium]
MGLLEAIAGLFSSDTPAVSARMIVDGRALLGVRPEQRPGPRDMIALLHRLGRFAEQEKIPSAVVFDGEPLHRAGDGDQFQGVTVYYAESPARRGARLLELARAAARRGPATLVCDDPEIERQAAEAGVVTLRVATLRKAMESSGEAGAEQRQPGGRRPDARPGREGGGGRRGRRRRGGGGGGGGPRVAETAPVPPETAGAAPTAAGSTEQPRPATEPATAPEKDESVRRWVDLVEE